MSFFDPLSFLLGFGTASGIGVGVYAARDRIPFLKKSDDDLAGGVSSASIDTLSPQAGGRYLDDMITFFEQLHLPGDRLRLTDVLVEPRLLRNPDPKLVIEEDDEGILVETDIYRVIPFFHQFPAMYASFNIETIALQDLESGHRHAAILGLPGTGKSVALATLGMYALGYLQPERFRDENERFGEEDDDDPDMSEEMRERHRKEREEVQRRAIEQLRIVQRREEDVAQADLRDLEVDFTKLFPIYIHIRDVDLNPGTYGGAIDPTEPFIRALPKYVSKATSQLSPPLMYNMLRSGTALILIDGYDELTPREAEGYFHWLSALVEHYGDNFMVITGPATGYDALTQAGFAPVFMRPYTDRRFEQLVDRWALAWEDEITERNNLAMRADNRNRFIGDVTMKLWSTLNGGIQMQGRRGFYDAFVRQHWDGVDVPAQILSDLAAYHMDAGRPADSAALHNIMSAYFGGGGVEAEIDNLFDDLELDEEAESSKNKKKKANGKKPDAENDIEKAVRSLQGNPLLHEYPDGSLTIKNPVVRAYLAGETLVNADEQRLAEIAYKPNWHLPLTFATAIVDITPTVLTRLNSRSDLLFTNMFTMADWLPDAPKELQWPKEILKRFGTALMHPAQFPIVRSHAVAALVSSHDLDGGVTYVLRQAVRSGHSNMRMLGCLGLGALGSDEAVRDLSPMLFDDVFEVQLAAGLALGAIGTEEALTPMVEALVEGDQRLRRAVAEALSSIPGEGHGILFDGSTHQDLEVRRAAAYGLARIPQTWSLIALYRMMLEDSQWSVRNAAEQAFSQAREPRAMGPIHYPEPERYQWLSAWIAERGESIPEGANGRQVLMRALQEAPPKVRVEAARALGQLAHTPAIKSLYATLTDREADVRMAAFNALGKMSERYGQPLPGLL